MPDVQDQTSSSCKDAWNLHRWSFGSVESFEEKICRESQLFYSHFYSVYYD